MKYNVEIVGSVRNLSDPGNHYIKLVDVGEIFMNTLTNIALENGYEVVISKNTEE